MAHTVAVVEEGESVSGVEGAVVLDGVTLHALIVLDGVLNGRVLAG